MKRTLLNTLYALLFPEDHNCHSIEDNAIKIANQANKCVFIYF